MPFVWEMYFCFQRVGEGLSNVVQTVYQSALIQKNLDSVCHCGIFWASWSWHPIVDSWVLTPSFAFSLRDTSHHIASGKHCTSWDKRDWKGKYHFRIILKMALTLWTHKYLGQGSLDHTMRITTVNKHRCFRDDFMWYGNT